MDTFQTPVHIYMSCCYCFHRKSTWRWWLWACAIAVFFSRRHAQNAFPQAFVFPSYCLFTLSVSLYFWREKDGNATREEIDDIWPFPYVTFGRFLSRDLFFSIASLRNFVLPDSIQTSGCIISPLPLWVTRPFSLPLLSMGSQPPRHRVLSQRFSLEHPFWTRHLPSYALLPPPHHSYFWGIPQRSMLIMANYRLNTFN